MFFADYKSISINGVAMKEIYIGGSLAWRSGGLPSEYQACEYVEAAANVGAYIDLGISYDTAATIEYKILTNSLGGSGYIFGAAENGGLYRCMVSAGLSGSQATYNAYGYNGANYSNIVIYVPPSVEAEFVYKIGNGSASITDITNDISGSKNGIADYTMQSTLYLFAQNYNGAVRYGPQNRRFYYFKYYDKNGELLRDMIPCYRKSDGVIGMYDLASYSFFTNIGSGAFTKGPDV